MYGKTLYYRDYASFNRSDNSGGFDSSRTYCIHQRKHAGCECQNIFLRTADSHLNEYRVLGNLSELPRYYRIKAALENLERLQKQLTADDYGNSHHN